MASLGNKFNAQDIDTTQRDYENLPDGIYSLEVIQSEVSPTSAGTGTMLKLRYSVVEPDQYKGRLVFANINLENPNSQAQEIGQRDLASLCRAVGLAEIEDSEELHFKVFTAKVGLSKARTGKDGKTYDPRNELKKFFFPDSDDMPEIGVTAGAPTPANDNKPAAPAKAAPAAAAAGGKSRPWGAKK